MNTVRIMPCLDLKNGRVVKGVQFNNLTDAGSPLELAVEYQRQGADELVILDIAATPDAKSHRIDIVKQIRKQLQIPVTVGGGIRTTDDARTLLLAGADKVAINTAAVTNPSLIKEMAEQFGRQCTVLAIDARRKGTIWEVCTLSGKNYTGVNVIEWAQQAEELGAGEILLTSWDRDGSLDGYDTDLISEIKQSVNIPIIASGGASKPEDMIDAVNVGASAVLAASIFHYKTYTVKEIKEVLNSSNIEVRLC